MKATIRQALFVLALFSVSVLLTGCNPRDALKKILDKLKKDPVATAPTATASGTATVSATGTGTSTDTATSTACVITVYETSSCPACKAAKEYLTSKGIPFVSKDVENDTAARQEMLDKATKAGVDASGVPFIDVCGDVMVGFDQGKLDELLKKHGYLGGTGSDTATSTATVTSTGTGTGTGTATTNREVIIYGTSGCSYCTKARNYLTSKKVAFTYKDVGTDQAANQELGEKARAKGIEVRGVPVIDICGDMTVGFGEATIDGLLKKHGLAGGSGASDPQADNPGQ